MSAFEPPPALVAVGDALGVEILGAVPIGGGDSSEAWRVELARDPLVVFVKTGGPTGSFEAEADGLSRLGASGAVRVPDVLHTGADLIVLEWIEPGRPGPDHDHELGRSLAALHRTPPPDSDSSATTSWGDGLSPTRGATRGPSSTARTG